MKKIIVLFFVLILKVGIAQTPISNLKSSLQNVISFSPGVAFSNFIYPNNNYYYNNSVGEYLIIYRRIFSKSNAFRIGFNGNSSNSKPNANDTLSSTTKNSTFRVGIGYERYQYLSKSWSFFYGADVQYYISNNTYNYQSGSNSYNKYTSDAYGFMPILGVLVQLNSRIGISLENGMKYSYSQNKSTYISSGSSSNSYYNTQSNIVEYIAPQLHIRFKF